MNKVERFSWRTMSGFDLGAVEAIADQVHPGFFEAPEVLAERQLLYPDGCYLLEIGQRPVGYIMSHPWRYAAPPALNTRLGAIPADADTYYIHDLALLPVIRRVGAPDAIVPALIKHAGALGLPNLSLVAVNGTAPFWARYGFAITEVESLNPKLKTYAEDAVFMVRPV